MKRLPLDHSVDISRNASLGRMERDDAVESVCDETRRRFRVEAKRRRQLAELEIEPVVDTSEDHRAGVLPFVCADKGFEQGGTRGDDRREGSRRKPKVENVESDIADCALPVGEHDHGPVRLAIDGEECVVAGGGAVLGEDGSPAEFREVPAEAERFA